MINAKIFRMECSDGSKLDLSVVEDLRNEGALLFVWESSLFLAAYIFSHKSLFHQKKVLEIGAGVGLPSLTCAHPEVGAQRVTISERHEEVATLRCLNKIVTLNNAEKKCIVMPLSWDEPESWPLAEYDYILGSDVLYSTEDFSCLTALLSHFFRQNPNAVFLASYKNRSSRRTILPHLHLHNMTASVISSKSFLHSCHLSSGICLFEEFDNSEIGNMANRTSKRQKVSYEQKDAVNEKPQHSSKYSLIDVNTFDGSHLIKIERIK